MTFLRRIAFLAVLASLCAGCSEWRAERAFRRVVAQEKSKDGAVVVRDLQQLVARWPATKAAEKARHEIEWLHDLEQSSTRGLGLLAWDAVRRVSMAAERYRVARGRYPERYADLVPRFLPGPILDPWGHEVGYLHTLSGYQAICYGADGIPGGSGEASDILVDTGREIRVGRTGR